MGAVTEGHIPGGSATTERCHQFWFLLLPARISDTEIPLNYIWTVFHYSDFDGLVFKFPYPCPFIKLKRSISGFIRDLVGQVPVVCKGLCGAFPDNVNDSF